MTAEPILPPITCPSSLVAACAPLLGFVPEKSLVAFIHGVPGRVSPVIMRVDLPPDGHAALAAAQAALSIDGTGGVAVDWVAWVEDHDSTRRDDLSCVRFLQELRQALDLVGIEVGGNLSTNGRMWWSHTCTEPECCPSQGTPLDAGIMDSVRAEYVYAGYAPLPSRELLEARIARDAGRMITVVEVLARRQPAQSTQRWRDAQVRILTQLFLPNNSCGAPAIPMTPSRTARMVRALEDIRVRDVVLHRLVVGGHHCDRCWEATIEVLCDALRSMPDGRGRAHGDHPRAGRLDAWGGGSGDDLHPASAVGGSGVPTRSNGSGTDGPRDRSAGLACIPGRPERIRVPQRGAPLTRADTPTRPRLRRLPGTCTFCGRSRVPASSPGLLGGNPPTAVGCPR